MLKKTDFLALLGTKGGPAIRTGSTMPTSSLLQINGDQIIVDCGLGVTKALVDQGMSLKDIRVIYITHLHSDHYLELGPLLHTAWTAGLKHNVRVYGPKGIVEYIHSFMESMRFDIDVRIADEGRPDLRKLVDAFTLSEGLVHLSDGWEIRAIRNYHPPLKDSFALSFKNAGKHIVFSGDTAYLPKLADFAHGADILVHEALLREGVSALVARVGNGDDRLFNHLLKSHTTAQEAAQIAVKAQVKALALHHLIPSDDPDYNEQNWKNAVQPYWQGKLYVGQDGLVIDI